MNLFLFLLLYFGCFGGALGQSPFVILPASIHWKSINKLWVTPLISQDPFVDITVNITGESSTGAKSGVYFEKFLRKQTGLTHLIEYSLLNSPNFAIYNVRVSVTGHNEFNSAIVGSPNLRSVFIQTDKVFYKPEEQVNIRFLPLTDEGELYHGNLSLFLVDANGFKIAKQEDLYAIDRFVKTSFVLPKYLKTGTWKIEARPDDPSYGNALFYDTKFNVMTYELPKFFVTMNMQETTEWNFLQVKINAWYPHGLEVSGNIELKCAVQTTGKVTSTSRTVQLLVGELTNGFWSGHPNLSRCFENTNIPSSEKTQILIIADIFDRGTTKAITVKKVYQPKTSGFKIVPLRPAFDEHTETLRVYFYPTVDPRMLSSTNIEVYAQCISTNANINGLNQSSQNFKSSISLNGYFDFKVDGLCDVYIVRARRKLTGFDSFSDTEYLVIPSVKSVNAFKLSHILPVDKVRYYPGDHFTAKTKLGTRLNYLVVCNSKYVVKTGEVRDDGLIAFDITHDMEGHCILVVYNISKMWYARTKSDMWLFYVEKGPCQAPFSLSLSTGQVAVNGQISATLTGEPYSLATVQAIDSKLNHLTNSPVNEAKPMPPWDFEVFLTPNMNSLTSYKSTSPMKLANFIDHARLIESISNVCKKAGEEMPGPSINLNGMNFEEQGFTIHNLCLRLLVESADKKSSKTQDVSAITQPDIAFSGVGFSNFRNKHPKTLKTLPINQAQNDVFLMQQRTSNGKPLDDIPDASDLVRSYFPEVWLFDDYQLDVQGKKELSLTAPHSVTEWTFIGTFWNHRKTSICQTPPAKVVGRRHVFMQVDLPSFVYENETIPAKVTVTADNLVGTTNMAVCFTGLSPVVCGDVGPDGNVGETDYTRIVLNRTHNVVVKTMQLRFLREGPQNISFQLRPESNNPGGDWHCSDDNSGVNDTVVQTVSVLKRVEQEEHYRNVIIYPQKRIFYPMPSGRVSDSARSLSLTFPDIITYSQRKSDDKDDEIFTDIEINVQPEDVIYSLVLEFSRFRPSLPNGYELDETKDRAPNRSRMRRQRRQTNSLANVLMELSYATYELRSLETYGSAVPSMVLTAKKDDVGYMLSHLMTYSNCTSDKSKSCAFYMFGPPKKLEEATKVEPSIFFTTLATSLLCEHHVEEEYICGLVNFLTSITNAGLDRANLDFHDQINFNKAKDQLWFMRSFIRQMIFDCGEYRCMREHWNKTITTLANDFYHFSESDQLDLRTEAMMAFQSTGLTEVTMRTRMVNAASASHIPIWRVNQGSINSILDAKFARSGDVLVNALALLAFTKDETIYDYYRKLYDFDSLANWLIESQLSNQRFENAIDTYFGWHSLYNYRIRHSPTGTGIRVRVNLTTDSEAFSAFSTDDMPFSIRLPTATRKIRIQSVGDGKIVTGVRLQASKRKRKKRDPSEAFPVVISASQERSHGSDRELRQTVCIETRSQLLNTLEIEHGLFTGFSTSAEDLSLLMNTTDHGAELLKTPQLSATAVHFILTKVKPQEKLCYELKVVEPDSNYSPEYLAPVAITARYNDVMGQLFLSPEVTPMKRRRKRSVIPELDLVDTVCLDNGNCTCAEKTCSVECDQCRFIKFDEICNELRSKPRFGAEVRFMSNTTVKSRNAEYMKLDAKVNTWQSSLPEPSRLTIWIRKCNRKCLKSFKIDSNEGRPRFLIVGDEKGLFEDEHSITPMSNMIPDNPNSSAAPQVLQLHYLLRDGDRLEKSTGCQELLGDFTDRSETCIREIDRFKRMVHYR